MDSLLERLRADGAKPVHERRALVNWLAGRALDARTSRGDAEYPALLGGAIEALTHELEALARVDSAHPGEDAAERLLVRLADGRSVETVRLPSASLCVSTQVGCAVGCTFCMTGREGLVRNLTADEILAQVVHARRRRKVRRVVFMGMGEPTHNLENVLAAAARFGRDGLISYRRQTLSTVGSQRAFARMLEAEVRPALALSLHSVDPAVRKHLLPQAGDDEIPALVAAADSYARTIGNPVQIEWTLLAGVNDRDADIDALAALVGGVYGYVNFIVWNRVDGADFAPTPRDRVVEIVRRLKNRGVLATMRVSVGADVDAACGQLRRRVAAMPG